jgi:predicted nucleotidyltransferase
MLFVFQAAGLLVFRCVLFICRLLICELVGWMFEWVTVKFRRVCQLVLSWVENRYSYRAQGGLVSDVYKLRQNSYCQQLEFDAPPHARIFSPIELKRQKRLFLIQINMKTFEKLKDILAEHKQEIRTRFKVKEIGIFGSYVHKEQKKKSDLDVLVSFSETIDLFTFGQLENYLSDILEVKVDLVMKDSLKPRLKDRILNEAVYV